jgi:hypothetical protein
MEWKLSSIGVDRFRNRCVRSRQTWRGFSVKKSRSAHSLRSGIVLAKAVQGGETNPLIFPR